MIGHGIIEVGVGVAVAIEGGLEHKRKSSCKPACICWNKAHIFLNILFLSFFALFYKLVFRSFSSYW